MCEALTGFDSCWDSSTFKDNELSELSSIPYDGLPDSHSSFRDAAQLVENAAGIFLQLKRGQKRGGGPGGGENAAFRSELFSPPPGLKAIKEHILSEVENTAKFCPLRILKISTPT